MCRRVNVHIHLLANINEQVATVKTIDHLQYTRIDPFGTIAGERCFRQNIRFESNKSLP
jgi:hypothetical protein